MKKTLIVKARPEIELLLACARSQMDSVNAERIGALLRETIDWDYLRQIALRHSLMPLLYRQLNATAAAAVPAIQLARLQDLFRRNAVHNLALSGELCTILKLFEDHGIAAVSFKGPTLAVAAYGDLALRQFGDLDILVREEDAGRAKDLLTARAYRVEGELTKAHEAAFLQAEYVYTLARADGGSHVELHWRAMPKYFSFPLELESFWDRLQTLPLAGATAQSLPPEILLLILCAHGTKHLWERFGWICDVAELVRANQDMDWRQVAAQADSLGSERMLLLGLALAKDMFGTILPEHILRQIEADQTTQSLAAQVREVLLRETQQPFGAVETSRFHLRARERIRDRVLYCSRVAVVPSIADWAFLPLPTPLSFLYYLIRPVRLARDYGLNRLKRFV